MTKRRNNSSGKAGKSKSTSKSAVRADPLKRLSSSAGISGSGKTAKTGKLDLLAEYEEAAQTKNLLPHISPFWPESREKTQRSIVGTLKPVGTAGLRTLKIQGWHLVSNPDFSQIQFELRPRTAVTAQKWHDIFSSVGHDYNVILSTKSFQYLLYRPICTECYKDFVCFYYLTRPPAPVAELE